PHRLRTTEPKPGARCFADGIVEQVADIGDIGGRDVAIVTTFDPRLQAAAEAAVQQVIARDGPKAAASQAALVAMAPDGAVRALVGGRDYTGSQFNRATQALRQPGSSFKPFVYLAGLEAGLHPSAHGADRPSTIGVWHAA